MSAVTASSVAPPGVHESLNAALSTSADVDAVATPTATLCVAGAAGSNSVAAGSGTGEERETYPVDGPEAESGCASCWSRGTDSDAAAAAAASRPGTDSSCVRALALAAASRFFRSAPACGSEIQTTPQADAAHFCKLSTYHSAWKQALAKATHLRLFALLAPRGCCCHLTHLLLLPGSGGIPGCSRHTRLSILSGPCLSLAVIERRLTRSVRRLVCQPIRCCLLRRWWNGIFSLISSIRGIRISVLLPPCLRHISMPSRVLSRCPWYHAQTFRARTRAHRGLYKCMALHAVGKRAPSHAHAQRMSTRAVSLAASCAQPLALFARPSRLHDHSNRLEGSMDRATCKA